VKSADGTWEQTFASDTDLWRRWTYVLVTDEARKRRRIKARGAGKYTRARPVAPRLRAAQRKPYNVAASIGPAPFH